MKITFYLDYNNNRPWFTFTFLFKSTFTYFQKNSLRLYGPVILGVPFHISSINCWEAFSDGWIESRNTYSLTFSHNLYSLIDLFPPQLSIPLYGPVPQHAILLSLKPMQYNHPKKKKKMLLVCDKNKIPNNYNNKI